ncbi:MAG: cytochrome c biogenesis protein CcsA [Burkholderiaceae bacterium]|nr:cytochrome c biogenesis protein CcsA [Burkholderiaceae bacterium]
MSIVLILFLLPAALYAAVWRSSAGGARSGAAGALLALALVLHAITLFLPMQAGAFHYGFAKLLSATVWIGMLLAWIETSRMSVGGLLGLLAPLATVVVVLPHFFPGTAFQLDAQPPLFVPHLVAGTLAYGVMFLAALQALLMMAARRQLDPRTPSQGGGGRLAAVLASGDSLPPLLVLERMLFRVIGVGFMLLLLTTVTGIVFSEEVFGKPLRIDHKTVFSLVATIAVGLLLAGRWLWGWRGRIAVRLTLGGFGLLLLSYVGSRFVLEVVLRRV